MNFGTLVNEFKKGKEKVKKRFNGMSTSDFFPAVDESFREAFTMPPSGSDIQNNKMLSLKDPQPPLPSTYTEEVNHKTTLYSIRDIKNYDSYIFSSLYNYGLAQVDFGFGTPLRVNPGALLSNNNIMLVDECGGKGMEALVALDEGVDVRFREQ
ncbi:hypothetical protein LIER_02897 [Lithospermum erythrorhizon]|uniref:Uncharacterized protein n=1 Tax=Lithospermum erythrorhizon TaxID=34254 RepID=A0AAV3NR50_LITER